MTVHETFVFFKTWISNTSNGTNFSNNTGSVDSQISHSLFSLKFHRKVSNSKNEIFVVWILSLKTYRCYLI